MVKRYDIEKDSYDYDSFLQSVIFEYIFVLKNLGILNKEEYYDWHYSLEEKMLTVEHDVTREDVIKNLKTQLRNDVTMEEVNDIVNGKMFNYDNVVNLVILGRVYKNLSDATKKIKQTFKNVLEDILNDK